MRMRLATFDVYPKTLSEFRQRTLTGAAVSIACTLLIAVLTVIEVADYLQVRQDDHLFVDTSRGQQLRINLNVTFPALPCSVLSLDTLDVSGNHAANIMQNIHKVRLDARQQVEALTLARSRARTQPPISAPEAHPLARDQPLARGESCLAPHRRTAGPLAAVASAIATGFGPVALTSTLTLTLTLTRRTGGECPRTSLPRRRRGRWRRRRRLWRRRWRRRRTRRRRRKAPGPPGGGCSALLIRTSIPRTRRRTRRRSIGAGSVGQRRAASGSAGRRAVLGSCAQGGALTYDPRGVWPADARGASRSAALTLARSPACRGAPEPEA